MFGAFSSLDPKMSVVSVCTIADLNKTSENVCSRDDSASLGLVYYVFGYCPSGTSEHVLRLILQVI